MSFYMKFNGWAGDDVNGVTARLAKIFKMDSGKASQAMRKIIGGQNWQFQWPISHKQAKTAHSYLRWLGFDLELNPAEQFFRLSNHSNSTSVPGAAFSKMVAPNLLNQLVELTGSISSAFTIALYKIGLGENTLNLRHHISLSPNFNPEAKIKFGEGSIGKVARDKQFYACEHIEENQTKLPYYKKKENLKSFLIMPVVYKNLEGVLVIDSKQGYSFSVKQQKILTGLANQMAWHLNQEKIALVE